MARLARVVVPGVAHHVTQRGNRRQPTFFREDDYRAYLELLGQWCGRCAIEVGAYGLMPNHVYLMVVPQSEDRLRRALGEAHRRYTRRINFREGGRGQGSLGLRQPPAGSIVRHKANLPRSDGKDKYLVRKEL